MGRTKVPIKKIANEKARMTCFNKRKGGLFKKAMELSILCDVEVTLIVKSPNGKFQAYSSSSLESALRDYRASDQTVPVSTNKQYDTMFNKGGAGGAAKSDDDGDEGDEQDDVKPKRGAGPPRAKRAAAAPKRKKRNSDEDEEDEGEEDDRDEDYGNDGILPTRKAIKAESNNNNYNKLPPEMAVSSSAAASSTVPINNSFLSAPSSASPGSVGDFSNYIPSSASWNPLLDKFDTSSVAPLVIQQPSHVLGASVVKKEGGQKRGSKTQSKQKKKPGPALSLDTSQSSFGGDVLDSSGKPADSISPPPLFAESSASSWMGGLTTPSSAFGLPSFGLGAFPATPSNMSL